MIKYRINGEYLDLFSDLKDFAITKQISKIGEIDSRHGDFSTAFKVPLTANNARILRYTPELNNYTNINTFDRYSGQLIDDEVVISDGYYQISKFSPTKKEIEIKFFGGNTDWFDLLKGRYINKDVLSTESIYPYDLNEYDHHYGYADTTASFSNTEGYIYFPFSNDSNTFKVLNDSALSVGDLAFGMYEHTLIKKIFDSVGINIKGTLLNDPDYYKSIICNDKGMLKYRVKETKDTYLTSGGRSFTLGTPETSINFDRVLEDSNVQQWNGSIYTAPSQTDSLRFYCYYLIQTSNNTVPFSGEQMRLKIDYTINGIAQTPIDVQMGKASVTPGIVGFTYDKVHTFTGVQVDDTFSFRLERTNTGSTSAPVWTNLSEYTGQGKVSEFIITTEDSLSKIQAKNLLPTVKQSDYIKDVLVRHGVVSQYDIKTKTLTLNKFEDIDNNRVNAPNWTSKIDLSKQIDVDFTKILSNYGQKSLFTYIDDSKDDNRLSLLKEILPYNLGTGALNIGVNSIDKEKTVFKSFFSSSAQILAYQGTYYLPYLPLIEGKQEDSSVVYEDSEIAPRVLIIQPNYNYEKVNTLGNSQIAIINDDDELPVQILYDELPFAYFSKVTSSTLNLPEDDEGIDSITYSLNFRNYSNYTGEDLFSNNYQFYNKILNAPFYVSLYMNLTALDVQQLDFFTPIFLEYKYDSGYYYIDSVEQYKGDGSTTKVNLVKI